MVCSVCRTAAWWLFAGQADAGRGSSEIRPSRMDELPRTTRAPLRARMECVFQRVEPASLLPHPSAQFRQPSCSPGTRVKGGAQRGLAGGPSSFLFSSNFCCCAFQEVILNFLSQATEICAFSLDHLSAPSWAWTDLAPLIPLTAFLTFSRSTVAGRTFEQVF